MLKRLGIHVTPLTQRRFAQFRANRRGWWSLWLFLLLFGLSLSAEFIANDRPLLIIITVRSMSPVFKDYAETDFGGVFPQRRQLPRSLSGGS
jgi:microcin C transport system permease protein